MKGNILVIYVFLLLLIGCSSINVNSRIEERAIDYAAEYDREMMEYFKLNPKSREVIKEYVSLVNKKVLPTTDVYFYEYHYDKIQPLLKFFIYCFQDSIKVFDNSVESDTILVNDKALCQINYLLKNGQETNSGDLEAISSFILGIIRTKLIILYGPSEVEVNDNYQIPSDIQKIIKPPALVEHENTPKYKLFCWDYFSSALFYIEFSFHEKQLYIKEKYITKIGVPHILI